MKQKKTAYIHFNIEHTGLGALATHKRYHNHDGMDIKKRERI